MRESEPMPDPGCFENCPLINRSFLTETSYQRDGRAKRADKCEGPLEVPPCISEKGRHFIVRVCRSELIPDGESRGESATVTRKRATEL